MFSYSVSFCLNLCILFQSLLKTADQLKIKGLCELPEGREGGVGISSAEVTPLPPNARRRNITKFRRFAGNKGRRFEPHRGRPPLFRGAATVKQEQPQQSPQQQHQQHHQQQHQQQQQVLQQQQQMQHAQHQQHQMQHQSHLQQGGGIAEPMRHIQVTFYLNRKCIFIVYLLLLKLCCVAGCKWHDCQCRNDCCHFN